MTHFRPEFLSIVFFLLVGLIWSGGHSAWLIILGVYIIGGSVLNS